MIYDLELDVQVYKHVSRFKRVTSYGFDQSIPLESLVDLYISRACAFFQDDEDHVFIQFWIRRSGVPVRFLQWSNQMPGAANDGVIEDSLDGVHRVFLGIMCPACGSMSLRRDFDGGQYLDSYTCDEAACGFVEYIELDDEPDDD